MPEGDHQFVNITLAGVRSPRVASRPDETTEPFGEEVCSCFRDFNSTESEPDFVGEILHRVAFIAAFGEGRRNFSS